MNGNVSADLIILAAVVGLFAGAIALGWWLGGRS
jgi:hypothetical protein